MPTVSNPPAVELISTAAMLLRLAAEDPAAEKSTDDLEAAIRAFSEAYLGHLPEGADSAALKKGDDSPTADTATTGSVKTPKRLDVSPKLTDGMRLPIESSRGLLDDEGSYACFANSPLAASSTRSSSQITPMSFQKVQCFKTQQCRFWLEGRCSRGNDCTFAHTDVELRDKPDLTKTKICAKWRNGQCRKSPSECSYAHGEEDMRPVAPPSPALKQIFDNQSTKMSQDPFSALLDHYARHPDLW